MEASAPLPAFELRCVVGAHVWDQVDGAELSTLFAAGFPKFLAQAHSVLTTRVAAVRGATVFAAGIPVEAHVTDAELELTYYPLCAGIALRHLVSHSRLVVGVSGPAGAGKSVLSRMFELLYPAAFEAAFGIYQALWRPDVVKSSSHQPRAMALGVDGYHRTNADIKSRGLRLYKGRPETFDGEKFLTDVRLLKQKWISGESLALPAYNRALHEPEEGQIVVDPEVGVVVVEGILLYTDAFRCRDAFDFALWLNMSESSARQRVNARKIAGGRSHEEVEAHYDRVDGPNHRDMVSAAHVADAVVHFHPKPVEQWLP